MRTKVHARTRAALAFEVRGFLLNRSWIRAYTAAAEFRDRHVRGRPAPTQP